jgi:hypothetical protein
MSARRVETPEWLVYTPSQYVLKLSNSCVKNLLQDSIVMKFRHFDSNISEESPALGVWVFVSDVKLVLPVLRSSYSTLVRQSRIDIKTDSQSTAEGQSFLPPQFAG